MSACVTHFDAHLIELTLSRGGDVTLHWEDNSPGKLRVTGTHATVNEKNRTIQLKLDGLTHLRVER